MSKSSGKKLRTGESGQACEKQIERLDREIVRLLNERAKWVVRKLEADVETARGAALSEQAFSVWQHANKGPLPEAVLRTVFRDIESGCRGLVGPTRVAYLGPADSYSHQAAIEKFGASAQLAPVTTIAAVFEELRLGHADLGLVPIENSTDGRVVDTLDMFAKFPVRICGEVQLRIHHNLLARCPRGDIRELYSKPQALSQCRDWISRHLPGVRVVEMASTAAAAQLAAEKLGAAAIASRQAALTYGLDVLADNIEDNKSNVTRFAVIGGTMPRRTGHDKTALMFELAHRPGSLADAMSVFKRGGLNLTWIESFPMPGPKKEYLFFVEIEGHADDARLRRALEALGRRTVRLEILGSYPKAALSD